MPPRNNNNKKRYNKKRYNKKRYNKKKQYNKAKTAPPYRHNFARSIQFANLRPSSAVVRFAARDKFLVAPVASANNKSVLQIPASYLGSPSANGGTWNSDSGFFHVPQAYNEWFPKFKYYKVIGAKLTVTVRPSGVGEPAVNQFHNKAFITLSADASQYGPSTSLESLEEGRDIVETNWKEAGPAGGGWTSARLTHGYSPKKVHHFKDYKDADNIRTVTTFNTAAAANTFFNVILSGDLDQATTGHPSAIVDVYGTYIVAFQEPTDSNIPQAQK